MLVLFKLVDQRHREVFHRDFAFAGGIDQQLVVADAEFAGAGAGHEHGGRGNHGPVERGLFAQRVKEFARGCGFGLVFGGEVGGIDHVDAAARHLQAAGAADHQQALGMGLFDGIEQGCGVQPLEPDRQQHRVIAAHGMGQRGGVGEVGGLDGEAGLGFDLAGAAGAAGAAGDGGHFMAAREGFGGEAGADVAGGAEDGDVHVLVPCDLLVGRRYAGAKHC